MKRALLLLSLAILACGGGSSQPNSDDLLGDYTFELALPDLADGIPTPASYRGRMRVTYATPDSIAGTWENVMVRQYRDTSTQLGYDRPFLLGFRNGSAYLVYARRLTGGGGTNRHRFAPTREGLTCESAGFIYTSRGSLGSIDGECTIQRIGR